MPRFRGDEVARGVGQRVVPVPATYVPWDADTPEVTLTAPMVSSTRSFGLSLVLFLHDFKRLFSVQTSQHRFVMKMQ